MCGECVEGYGVPVYSYTLSCVECSEYRYNWMQWHTSLQLFSTFAKDISFSWINGWVCHC